jgi:hypothetical protein
MNLRSDKRQNIQIELDFSSRPMGEARKAGREETESLSAVNDTESPASTNRLMEEVCERENLKEALRQVKANKGSAGVDGMIVDELDDHLKQHWPAIREQLFSGTYEPHPVRRVEIPKPDGGGVRKLGIPSVLDRFIQQAVMQVLQRRWGPNVFRSQLWFSTEAIGSSSSSTGTAVYRRRLSLVRGSGFGEIFRPGFARQTDGAGRQARGRQAAAETHPGVLECWGDGERVGQPKRGRDPTGRSTFATAQQSRAR